MRVHAQSILILIALGAVLASADSWQMQHRDRERTGRSDFVVPASRMNDTFFDVIRWQKRTPNSPNEGNLGASSMVFFDGVGPGGANLVVCGYHWPKGVQGMDRHTGAYFWSGNPAGGESIGEFTPAFANYGTVVYVCNDATGSPGHPTMAFLANSGPDSFWHNGDNPNPNELSNGSPVIAPDGRIFRFAWNDRPYAAMDFGTTITHSWAAQSGGGVCFNSPALYRYTSGDLRVITSGRWGLIQSFLADDPNGTLAWSVATSRATDACPTVDPDNGNVYVAASNGSVWIIGVDRDGNPLWDAVNAYKLVYEWINGVNNTQSVGGAGCLSHDGATYYFQSHNAEGEGRLWAINTADGTVKWSYETGATGTGDGWRAAPIVTPNGVIIVGNNDGGAYYALSDDVTAATLLDTLVIEPNTSGIANAVATPTLSADGMLYIPARLTWMAGNGDGEIPTFNTQNLFNAFDINDGAVMDLPPPPGQLAKALNNAVDVSWRPISDPTGVFDHYAVYRELADFGSVSGLTPIDTVPDVATDHYRDETAVNGTTYHYAVTAVSTGGGETTVINALAPRTPYDEDDLQIISMSRLPRFPRYLPIYNVAAMTEPSGFGPYITSAAVSLDGGQDEFTQRWPELNDPVTYVATVRNAGTNPYNGTLGGTWELDGGVIATPSQVVALEPGDTVTFEIAVNWDDLLHDITFTLDVSDDHPENDTRYIGTKSVPFLTYVDASYIEDFREISTPEQPLSQTDDMLDWLWRHADRMNEMFDEAGSLKRVHYDVLAVTRDGDADPSIDRTPFAIFPFRYYYEHPYWDPRYPGYYADDDIDYGLCHEMSHQLGLIDLYRLDVHGQNNYVSGLTRWATDGLMRVVSHYYSENSAHAMDHWLHKAHGYYGQYLYYLPETVQLRIVGNAGQPIDGASIKVYQKCERPGLGEVITTQIKAQGVTDENGLWTIPNVPLDPDFAPQTYAGDLLRDNPFGYIAVTGTNGILHFEIEYDGDITYEWLEITDVNNAYWNGQTTLAIFERQIPVDYEPVVGDLNCDGAVNNGDIDPFVLAITDPAQYQADWPNCDIMLADINGDGFANNGDIDAFVALLSG